MDPKLKIVNLLNTLYRTERVILNQQISLNLNQSFILFITFIKNDEKIIIKCFLKSKS
jgi:hypothetical protein